MKINITKLLTIISFILFCIFFIIGIQTYKDIFGALCVISLLSFFILLVVYLNETLDDEWQDFYDKYGSGLYIKNKEENKEGDSDE